MAGADQHRTRDERGAAATALAAVLAVLAVVMVLGTTTAAVTQFVGRDDSTATDGKTGDASDPPSRGEATGGASPSAPATPQATTFTDGQIVYGDSRDNAFFEVPSTGDGFLFKSGWTLGYEANVDPETFISKDRVGVTDPAVYREIECKGNDSTQLGFVAFGAPYVDSTAQDASRAMAEEWVRVASFKENGKEHYPSTELKEQQLTLADGTEGWWNSSVIDLGKRQECGGSEVEMNAMSFDTGKYVATIILVRDLDVAQAMDDATVRKIYESAQIEKKS